MLVEGTEIAGSLRKPLAQKWGVPEIAVAGGGGDNAATACGMGVLHSGIGFVSLGTSGVLFAATDRFAPNTQQAVHAFCHAVPETWHQMGVILSATDSLNWLAEIAGRSAADLTKMLPDVIESPSPVIFLPYVSGERTPHNDPSARAAFFPVFQGIRTWSTSRNRSWRAVAFAFTDCVKALSDAGTTIEAVYAVGGRRPVESMASNDFLRDQIEHTCSRQSDYGAAFGAAKLGLRFIGGRFHTAAD